MGARRPGRWGTAASLAGVLAVAACSTANEDVQIVVSSNDGASVVFAATHERSQGSKFRLRPEVRVYIRNNRRIGFSWHGSAGAASRTAILERICGQSGIDSVRNEDGADLCAPR